MAKDAAEIKNYAGDTPLLVAVKNRATDSAAVLAELNGNIFAKDAEGNSAFDIGLKQGTTFFDALLTTRTGDMRDIEGQSIIHYLVRNKNKQAIDFCIKKSIPLSVTDIRGVSPLTLAYSQKDIDSVDIAAMLILANAEPERGSHAYFEDAVKTRNLSMRFNDGQSPLHIAVILGETGIVRYLIEQGADIKAKDISGSTALHEAVRYGDIDINRVKRNGTTIIEGGYIKTELINTKNLVVEKAASIGDFRVSKENGLQGNGTEILPNGLMRLSEWGSRLDLSGGGISSIPSSGSSFSLDNMQFTYGNAGVIFRLSVDRFGNEWVKRVKMSMSKLPHVNTVKLEGGAHTFRTLKWDENTGLVCWE